MKYLMVTEFNHLPKEETYIVLQQLMNVIYMYGNKVVEMILSVFEK